jgi:hypothetical protein
MSEHEKPHRMRIVIRDEETGEEVASASGVETLILLVAPDDRQDTRYRRILIGDADLSVQLLFDVFRDITEKLGQGTTMDLTDVLDDQLLLEVTEGLPLH